MTSQVLGRRRVEAELETGPWQGTGQAESLMGKLP